jgi:hypothetical protein
VVFPGGESHQDVELRLGKRQERVRVLIGHGRDSIVVRYSVKR